MAWRLVGTKPLSEPVLDYCLLDPKEKNLSEILIKIHTTEKMYLNM